MAFNTLAKITRQHAASQPEKEALTYTDDNRSWTYADLDAEACRVANALQSLGIGSQDRVAYLDKNAPEYFSLFFGGTKLNAVSVAVNWRLAPPEMEYILNHSQARVLVIGEDFLGHLAQMNLELDHVVVIGDPADGYEDGATHIEFIPYHLDDAGKVYYYSRVISASSSPLPGPSLYKNTELHLKPGQVVSGNRVAFMHLSDVVDLAVGGFISR